MISHIALLRAVNVGENMLKMERLREILAELGLGDVKTYLQSGNALFRCTAPPARLSAMIEELLRGETRLAVSVVIRTPAQLKRIIDANPFLREPGIDRKKLHVTFLARPASRSGLSALGDLNSGVDRWRAAGAEIYLHCPDGYARSKLNNTTIEKLLATRATTRNWNTITALYDMSRE